MTNEVKNAPPLEMDSRSLFLFIKLCIECSIKDNSNFYKRHLSLIKSIREKIKVFYEKRQFKSEFMRKIIDKTKDKNDVYNFLYPKIKTDIIASKHDSIKFTEANPSKIEELYKSKIIFKYPDIEKTHSNYIAFFKYLDDFFKINIKESKIINVGKNDFIEQLSNTKWFLYYYNYNSSTPLTEITRSFIEFKDLNQLDNNTVIYDYVDEKTMDFFEGVLQFNFENSSYVIINLKNKIKINKELQIRFRLDPDIDINDNTIIIGQYIDFDVEKKNIISGTLILENIKGHFTNSSNQNDIFNENKNYFLPNSGIILTSRELIYDSKWEKYIPEEIADFLQNKWKNFTKTKTDRYSLNSLKEFNSIQDKKDYKKYKFDSKICYDLFIITPEESIKNNERRDKLYQEICENFFEVIESKETNKEMKMEECYKANDKLANYGIKKIYYRKRFFKFTHSDEQSENVEPKKILEELDVMKQSRFVILIMPAKLYSSALVKVGCALQMEKPIFVFRKKRVELPAILRTVWKNIINVPTEYKSISEIPGHLTFNYHEMFNFDETK
jgi:hypothetical protein